jgi:hypothetical protein
MLYQAQQDKAQGTNEIADGLMMEEYECLKKFTTALRK